MALDEINTLMEVQGALQDASYVRFPSLEWANHQAVGWLKQKATGTSTRTGPSLLVNRSSRGMSDFQR